jgi:hypothetical protein
MNYGGVNKYSFCLFFCLFMIVGFAAKSHATLSVSGNLVLPAPASGTVKIDLYLEDTSGYSYTAQTYTFLDGQSTKTYSLDTSVFTEGRLRYNCWSNCGEIYPNGYLTSTGTSYKWEDARKFTLATSGVSINTPLGYRVSGDVMLPGADELASGISLEVIAQQTEYYDAKLVDNSVTLNSSTTSAGYSLLLPPDPGGYWTVHYEIVEQNDNQYYHTGYYVTALSTTYITTEAEDLAGSQNHSEVDLTLLRGKKIEGTLSLPTGREAPSGGLEIDIDSYNLVYYGGDDNVEITIAEGQASGSYSLIMPYDDSNSWYVKYGCGGYFYSTCIEEGYMPNGHYSGSGQATFYARRDGYGALSGAENHSNVNMTLIPASEISGTMQLPASAPSGGFWITMVANDALQSGPLLKSVFIDQGKTSTDYTISIPSDSSQSWHASHMFTDEKPGYIIRAYYAQGGTTHLSSEATLLTGGAPYNHIDMTAMVDVDNDGIPDVIDDDISVGTCTIPTIMLLLLDGEN